MVAAKCSLTATGAAKSLSADAKYPALWRTFCYLTVLYILWDHWLLVMRWESLPCCHGQQTDYRIICLCLWNIGIIYTAISALVIIIMQVWEGLIHLGLLSLASLLLLLRKLGDWLCHILWRWRFNWRRHRILDDDIVFGSSYEDFGCESLARAKGRGRHNRFWLVDDRALALNAKLLSGRILQATRKAELHHVGDFEHHIFTGESWRSALWDMIARFHLLRQRCRDYFDRSLFIVEMVSRYFCGEVVPLTRWVIFICHGLILLISIHTPFIYLSEYL